jgi:hypothetical protein
MRNPPVQHLKAVAAGRNDARAAITRNIHKRLHRIDREHHARSERTGMHRNEMRKNLVDYGEVNYTVFGGTITPLADRDQPGERT